MTLPLDVVLVMFPHGDLHGEFDALAAEPGVTVRHVSAAQDLGEPDLIVLPGSEATMPDLAWLRETGLERAIHDAAAHGALLFGICGGFQMMGTDLHDPEGIEGAPGDAKGLGLFDVATTFTRDVIDEKVAVTSSGGFLEAGTPVSGFELHGGRSRLRGGDAVPLFEQQVLGGGDCPLGLATRDLAVMGTYLHGVLSDDAFRARLLAHLRERQRSRQTSR